jgi:hypothetical protein
VTTQHEMFEVFEQKFAARIGRIVMMYTGDCEETDEAPTLEGFHQYIGEAFLGTDAEIQTFDVNLDEPLHGERDFWERVYG